MGATPAFDGALAAPSLAMVCCGLGHERILEKSNGKRRHPESHHQPGSSFHAKRHGREDEGRNSRRSWVERLPQSQESRATKSHNGQLGEDHQEGDGENQPHTTKLCQRAQKSNADYEESTTEQPKHGLGTAEEKLLDVGTIVEPVAADEAGLVRSPQQL